MSEEYNPPFKYKTDEQGHEIIIGKGGESVVKAIMPGHVVKEINLFKGKDIPKPDNLVQFQESPEHLKALKDDYQRLKAIFGDSILETDFIIGHKKDSPEQTNYIVQREIQGQPLNEMLAAMTEAEKGEFVKAHRDQILDLIWKSKKAFIEIGMPIDFYSRNLMFDENEDKIILVDFGWLSEGKRAFEDKNYHPEVFDLKMKTFIAEKSLVAIERLSEFSEGLREPLNLSDEEKARLDEQYGVDDHQFNKRKSDIINILNELQSKPDSE